MGIHPPTAAGDEPRAAGPTRRAAAMIHLRQVVHAIRVGNDAMVEQAVIALSRRNRLLAPLALVVGAFVMLFHALRLLVTNWRLTLLQVLPAMWIWMAMFNLKVHALKGRSFNPIRGPVAWAAILLIVAITAVAYYLNAVFAFSIARPGPPQIRLGFEQARRHRRTIVAWGALIGLALGFATIIVARWGRPWFGLINGIVIGVMMFTYVAIPSQLIGLRKSDSAFSARDRLAASTVGGAVGAIVCTPPYLLGRLGILMLGWGPLWVVGAVVLAVGVLLQAGAQGSVSAIKMSAKIVAAREPGSADAGTTAGAGAEPSSPSAGSAQGGEHGVGAPGAAGEGAADPVAHGGAGADEVEAG